VIFFVVFFSSIIKVVKPFMKDKLNDKIHILKSRAALSNFVDADQVCKGCRIEHNRVELNARY
jgi:hypothetical protein